MSGQRYERVSPSLPRTFLTPLFEERRLGFGHMIPWDLTTDILQVSGNEDDSHSPLSPVATPSSPPPSFRSRASSPASRRVDATLTDAFDADGSDSDEENDGDDRQRLMRGTPSTSSAEHSAAETPATTTTSDGRPAVMERRTTHIPVFTPAVPGRVYGGGSQSDGVFANLSAKPERGEKIEEHPPVRPFPAQSTCTPN